MKTEQRIEELQTEIESVEANNTEKFMETFVKNSREVKFLQMKELYRLGNSPEECKQILRELGEQAELFAIQALITEDAFHVFDEWLAE